MLTYRWTSTDCAGNSSSCDQLVTVVDNTPPIIVCPADVTFECVIGDAGMATATDNCDLTPLVSGPEVIGSLDNCGLGMLTYRWTSTDCAGNSSSCDQLVTVVDNTPPVIECPIDITFHCEMGDAGEATVTDNCDPNPGLSFEDVAVGDPALTIITRTWTAIDCAGNTSTCEQIITIECPGETICTYTQGYFGNYNGTSCDGETGGYTTVEMIEHSVSNWGGALVIGKAGRSVTVAAGQANCVVDRLPGGSGIGILPAGDISICNYSLLTKQGRISNKLLAQTLVLGLNLGIGTPLGGVELDQGWIVTAAPDGGCGSEIPLLQECIYNLEGYLTEVINPYWYCKIDQSVIDMIHAIMLPANVDGLFELANQALGGWGTYSDTQLTAIAGAADMINNVFDECRVFMGYMENKPVCAETSFNGEYLSSMLGASSLKAYPNPFSEKVFFEFVSNVDTHARLEIFNLTGEKVITLINQRVKYGVLNRIEYKPSTEVSGILEW